MFPKKGTIAVGSDADIVILNPDRAKVISAAAGVTNCDYSLYEGMQVAGSVETVIFRGTPIVEDGRYVASGEQGAFLPRARFADPRSVGPLVLRPPVGSRQ